MFSYLRLHSYVSKLVASMSALIHGKEDFEMLSIRAQLSRMEAERVRGNAFYDSLPSQSKINTEQVSGIDAEPAAVLEEKFIKKISEHRELTLRKAGLDAQNFALAEELPTLQNRLTLLQAQCREAQATAKLTQAEQDQLRKLHEERRVKLEEETATTCSNITSKVDAEEASLQKRLEENQALALKLANVIDMVRKQQEHEEAVKKALSLQQQLHDAKAAQRTSIVDSIQKEQEQRTKQLADQAAKNEELIQMESLYIEKNAAFRSSLESNHKYHSLLVEKRALLEQRKTMLQQEREGQMVEVRRMEAKVIAAALMPDELATLKAQHIQRAAKCKSLQLTLKALKDAEKVPGAGASSSSSSSLSSTGKAAEGTDASS